MDNIVLPRRQTTRYQWRMKLQSIPEIRQEVGILVTANPTYMALDI